MVKCKNCREKFILPIYSQKLREFPRRFVWHTTLLWMLRKFTLVEEIFRQITLVISLFSKCYFHEIFAKTFPNFHRTLYVA